MQLVVDSFLSGDPDEMFHWLCSPPAQGFILLSLAFPWNALQALPVGIKYFPGILNGQEKKKRVAWVTQQNNHSVWVSVPAYLPRHRWASVH